jgi:hypothetical protein
MVLKILRNHDFRLLTLIAKIIKMSDDHYYSFNEYPVACPGMAVMHRGNAEGHYSRPRPFLIPGPT